MKKWLTIFAVVFMSLAVGIESGSSATSETREFYKGKTGEIVVGYGPGGGYDILARVLAPYLQKHTEATWMVNNKPAGGGIGAVNYLYNNAKRDGLSVHLMLPIAHIVAQVVKAKEVKYDLSKVIHLGAIGSETSFLNLRSTLPYKSLKEMIASGQEIKFTANNRMSQSSWMPLIVFKGLGMKARTVVGYSGIFEQFLALKRGEGDVNIASYASSMPNVEAGTTRLICAFSEERSPAAPDVPTIFEAVELPEEIKSWCMMYARIMVDPLRTVMTCPGVPEDRVAFLRTAVENCMKEKEFISIMKKLGENPKYTSSKEIEQRFNEWLQMKESKAKVLREAIFGE